MSSFLAENDDDVCRGVQIRCPTEGDEWVERKRSSYVSVVYDNKDVVVGVLT
jgi:hypothetical protein